MTESADNDVRGDYTDSVRQLLAIGGNPGNASQIAQLPKNSASATTMSVN
jgi:hypothetical protein